MGRGETVLKDTASHMRSLREEMLERRAAYSTRAARVTLLEEARTRSLHPSSECRQLSNHARVSRRGSTPLSGRSRRRRHEPEGFKPPQGVLGRSPVALRAASGDPTVSASFRTKDNYNQLFSGFRLDCYS